MVFDLNRPRRLAVFACVADQGSFAGAARVLRLSRSSVSEQVASLEDSLGIRLFQRTTRRLTLTADGERVYPEAASVLASLGRVEEIAQRDDPSGCVRLTTAHDFANAWLIPRLGTFSRLYPDITFDLVLADAALDLIDNRIDLAVRGVVSDLPDSLIARTLFRESLGVLASPDYLDRFGEPKDPQAAASHRWIVLSRTSPDGKVRLRSGGRRSVFAPHSVHICDSPLAMRRMIEEGLGIGLELSRMVAPQLDAGRLVSILPGWTTEPVTFALLYPSRRHVPKRVRLLIDYLLQEGRKEPRDP